MAAATTDSEAVEVYWVSMSCVYMFLIVTWVLSSWDATRRVPHPVHPGYKATGGYCREDAIMILRRFYITENVNGALIIHSNVVHFLTYRRSSGPSFKGKQSPQDRNLTCIMIK